MSNHEDVIDGRDLVVTEGQSSYLVNKEDIKQAAEVYDQIRQAAKERMTDNIDYGVIPGTGNKPTLLKPGAEKLCNFFGLAVESETIKEEVDWEKKIAFFRVKTMLRSKKNGQIVATGIGSANSRERKFQAQVDKGMFADIINTLEKMAQKRSHIDATLRATGMSSMYTQDVDEMPQEAVNSGSKPAQKQTTDGGGATIEARIKSKYNNAKCGFCGEKHINKGDEIVKVGEKWGVESCLSSQSAADDEKNNDGPPSNEQIAKLDSHFSKQDKGSQQFWAEFKDTGNTQFTYAVAERWIKYFEDGEGEFVDMATFIDKQMKEMGI